MLRVSAVQCLVGSEKTLQSAENLISEGVENGVEVFLFPEYFSYTRGGNLLKVTDKTIEFLKSQSYERGCIIAGNVIVKREKGYFNTLYIFESGDIVGVQEKLHPTKSEKELGICAGEELRVFEIRGVKYSALICADILYPEICRVSALKGAEMILNPVVSFRSSELPGRDMRHCLYFTRAFDNSYAIIKAGGPGVTFLGSETVGRSLIATPEGILSKFKDENSEELVFSDINLESLRKYRRINYTLYDRNPLTYRELLM